MQMPRDCLHSRLLLQHAAACCKSKKRGNPSALHCRKRPCSTDSHGSENNRAWLTLCSTQTRCSPTPAIVLATGIVIYTFDTQGFGNKHLFWYLPSIVKAKGHDREGYSTFGASRIKLLLGHRLNITEESLRRSVEEVIKKQVALHGLKEVNLDHSKVDWQRMIEKSVSVRSVRSR